MREPNHRRLSFYAAVVAFVLFGSTAVVVKTSTLSAVDLVFLRMLICFILCTIFVHFKHYSFEITVSMVVSCLSTSCAIFLNMICLFFSFKIIPISIASNIFFSGPLFTILFRKFFFKREISSHDSIAIILSASGISILLIQGGILKGLSSSGLLYFFGCTVALLGGLLFGLIPILEKNCEEIPPIKALQIQSLFACLCLAPFSFRSIFSMRLTDISGVLILSTLFTLLPFWLWWTATRKNNNLSPFLFYLDPITATIISLLIFHQELNIAQWCGLITLVTGAIFHVSFSHFSNPGLAFESSVK